MRVSPLILATGVAVVLLGGVALGVARDDRPVVRAVPDRVYSVPDHLAERDDDGSWSRRQVEEDAAVGVTAVAYVMQDGLPVLVDADAGDYHLVDLPGFIGNEPAVVRQGSPGLGLSPDGRYLAFGFVDRATSGVRLVDLVTGDHVGDVEVQEDGGTTVAEDFAWSDGGRWLAWSGSRYRVYPPRPGGFGTGVAGRIRVGATVSEPIRMKGGFVGNAMAIDPAGRVYVDKRGETYVWDDGRVVDVLDERIAYDVAGRRVTFGDDGVLGWVDDRRALVRFEGSVRLVDEGDLPADGPLVTTIGPAWTDVSVAVDLVPVTGSPSLSRPEPAWPWSDAVRRSVAGLLLPCLLLAWGAHLLRRRATDDLLDLYPRRLGLAGFALGTTAVVAWSFVGYHALHLEGDSLTATWLGGASAVLVVGVGLAFDRPTRAVGVGVGLGAVLGVGGEFVVLFFYVLSCCAS